MNFLPDDARTAGHQDTQREPCQLVVPAPRADQPLTLKILKDHLRFADPAIREVLQRHPSSQGNEYLKCLSQADVAVCAAHDAGDSVLIGVRHFVAQHWGKCDLPAIKRAQDWLVAEHGLTRDQSEVITLSDLLKKLNPQKRRSGRPRTTEKDSATKVIGALNRHHGYDNGSVTNLTPATNRGLQKAYGLSSNALSRFLKDRFRNETEPTARYKAACRVAAKLGALLKLWNRDFPGHNALLHDEEGEEETRTQGRRAGRTPGSRRDEDD
jgi:hypothetical protein